MWQLSLPQIQPDWKNLKYGIWGNSWKNWGEIALAFICLYAVLAGYFTGMLFASKEIRGLNYRSLPSRHFGDFDKVELPMSYSFDPSETFLFNRPQGCVNMQRTISIGGQDFQQDDGIQACDTGKDGNQWVLFPWTLDSNALGAYPGCANAEGAGSTGSSFISRETSPAFTGTPVDATPELIQTWVCQNFPPVTPTPV